MSSQLSPRELRRQQRVETSRAQILDTAEELFGDQGYRATSLQQVAERCEFSVGALYQFFTGKEELLQAVMNRRGAELLGRLRSAVDPAVTGDVNLLNLLDAITAYFRLHPAFARLSIRLYSPGEDAPKDLGPAGEGFALTMKLFARAIAAGQKEGRLRSGDPRALARLATTMITAYHRADPAITPGGGGLSDPEFREILTRAFAIPRPEAVLHPEALPHPEAVPHREPVPHGEPVPHREPVPHGEAPPARPRKRAAPPR